MSKDNPFDDEEEFIEQINEHAIPQEEEIIKETIDVNAMLVDVNKEIKKYYDHQSLAQITVSFEFVDHRGYSYWVNRQYMKRVR